jgi:GNAT superfamily N-acetyltransferase
MIWSSWCAVFARRGDPDEGGRRARPPGRFTDPSSHQVSAIGNGICWVRPYDAVVVATTIDEAETALRATADRPVQVSSADRVLRAAVERSGWRTIPAAPFDVQMRLDVRRSAPTVLRPGYRLRSASEGDDLVGIHRASWSPPQLPFTPGLGPEIDPSSTSGFDAERLASVQAWSGYGLDAHLVVEEPNGALVASCIAWHDSAIGVTSIEPLGVHPDHRRLGLAGALALGVAAQAREREIGVVLIHPRGDDAYPAPRGAYRHVGFVEIDRMALYVGPR